MNLIRRGDRSPTVADLQGRLEKLGYEIAPQERGGVYGASTEGAVREFQQRRGLDVDGILGPGTWRELVEASWTLGGRLLYLREPPMRGDDVRDLQVRLNALGFPAGKHDGIFGPQTSAAVREFQRNLTIDEDGIVGGQTVRALERLRLVTRVGLGARIHERERRKAQPKGLAGKRVAIDPGHGGGDHGAVGASGEKEADLAFRLAAAVAEALEAKGASTVLTRGPHGGATDSARAAVARDFGAELLLSIHLNAYPGEMAVGAAAYYFEHEGVASEPGEHLAELLVSELMETAGRVNCRTHGKNYPLLRETRMPAVVVEPCFITNTEELKLCSDRHGSSIIILSLVRAIERYFS